jgi:gluconokinase
MIYVLFGPPGVGKTYIGDLIASKLDVKFFDADVLFDEELRKMVRAGKFSVELRELFFDKFKQVTEHLMSDSGDARNLLLAQAFTKDKNRRDFLKHFDGQVKFILVHAPKNLAHARMMDRIKTDTHVIDEGAFEYVWREFEEATIEHVDIINDSLDNKHIVDEFIRIMEQ